MLSKISFLIWNTCFDFDCVFLLLNSVAQHHFWMLATHFLLNLTFIVFEISAFNKWKSNYILLLDIKLFHMSISVNSLFCHQCLPSKFSDHHVSIVTESNCNFLWVIRFFLNRICLVFFECVWSSSETSFFERLKWRDFVAESSRMMMILYCDRQSKKATSRSLHSVSTFVRSLQSGSRRREYSDSTIQIYWFSSQYEKKCADGKENSIWSRQTANDHHCQIHRYSSRFASSRWERKSLTQDRSTEAWSLNRDEDCWCFSDVIDDW